MDAPASPAAEHRPPKFRARRKAAAWGVHLYTALGLPLAFLAAIALSRADAGMFFLCSWIACVIDATDGMLARRVRVREVIPSFDGRKLDDIVDYLTFVFLPMLALPALKIVPGLEWVSVIPLVASAYGFCQDRAKTQESFVGFPSYWNIIVLYLYVLKPPPEVAAGILIMLSVLVFVPIHYIYPSKAKMWMPVTIIGGVIWGLAVMPVCLRPDAPWAPMIAAWSLLYPTYYFFASLVHHFRHARHQSAVHD